MVKPLEFRMDKPMQNKGFTLIEMLLVLSILSIVIALFPFTQYHSIYLHTQVNEIKERLLYAQSTALKMKKKMNVTIQGSNVNIANQNYHLQKGMSCQGKNFSYNELGNVSNAQTITCALKGITRKIVIQLGSGQLDVR